jgi:hypothetical protein
MYGRVQRQKHINRAIVSCYARWFEECDWTDRVRNSGHMWPCAQPTGAPRVAFKVSLCGIDWLYYHQIVE